MPGLRPFWHAPRSRSKRPLPLALCVCSKTSYEMKQIYKITYPTGKIYIGKDSVGSHRYFGSPDMDIINEDFMGLPDSIRKDYTIRKEILWESSECSEQELSQKEIEFIRLNDSNNPDIGYNRWPKYLKDT
jgi:hypothetical protein